MRWLTIVPRCEFAEAARRDGRYHTGLCTVASHSGLADVIHMYVVDHAERERDISRVDAGQG